MDPGMHSSLSPAHTPDSKDDIGKNKAQKSQVKSLNRVPRACNACRKQKMKCDGAENPPCKRCRNANLECLFEKPSREGTLTGEAGLERIRSLESQVVDIRNSQQNIQNTLHELVSHLRSPSGGHQLPSSIPGGGGGGSIFPFTPQAGADTLPHGLLPPIVTNNGQRRGQYSHQQYTHPHHPQHPASVAREDYHAHPGAHPSSLPPISALHDSIPSAVQQPQSMPPPRGLPARLGHRSGRGTKPGSSTVTSNEDSDDEGFAANGDLPAAGLVAPWEVLRGLAEVAAEVATKENGTSVNNTEPPTRAVSPSARPSDKAERPAKRRKMTHPPPPAPSLYPDVVSKRIISEEGARELFKIFYDGCSTFLPTFDARHDTFDALRERSPFAVDCICMVASKVRDGGNPTSDMTIKMTEEVQTLSCKTLFSSASRLETVQAMILVSGWSDNGWLTGGHAVRMAMEVGLHKAWPRLYKRIKSGRYNTTANPEDDRELVIQSRTWFCLFLFEHQMSFGTGRPAILKDDESIYHCRDLLQHPLTVEDDMRLVSTVELMSLREHVQSKIPPDAPLNDETFQALEQADRTFLEWFQFWDNTFAKHYKDANFYRQSLLIQQYYAQLFHGAHVLRGVKSPDDVAKMSPAQRRIALKCMDLASKSVSICIRSPSYREGLKYAVHYTHMTATFAASFLLRLARLFPDESDISSILTDVGELAEILGKIPAGRYARTLRAMMRNTTKKHKQASKSPDMARTTPAVTQRTPQPIHTGHTAAQMIGTTIGPPALEFMDSTPLSANAAWAGVDQTWFPGQEVPMWMNEHNLGDGALASQGMDAFIFPADAYDSARMIW